MSDDNDYYNMGYDACESSMQAKLDALEAENARLKAGKPIIYVDAGHLREVSNGNDMLIYAQSEPDEQGRLEPLYIARDALKGE